MMALLQTVGPVLGMIGIVIGAYATYRTTIAAKTIESEATPYDKLSDRVGLLESQVESLQSQSWMDRKYIRRLMDEWPYHKPLPTPMPGWIAETFRGPIEKLRSVTNHPTDDETP